MFNLREKLIVVDGVIISLLLLLLSIYQKRKPYTKGKACTRCLPTKKKNTKPKTLTDTNTYKAKKQKKT